jgi:hypothetical protein
LIELSQVLESLDLRLRDSTIALAIILDFKPDLHLDYYTGIVRFEVASNTPSGAKVWGKADAMTSFRLFHPQGQSIPSIGSHCKWSN